MHASVGKLRGLSSLELELQMVVCLWCGGRVLGPLEEQQVPLTAKPSL